MGVTNRTDGRPNASSGRGERRRRSEHRDDSGAHRAEGGLAELVTGYCRVERALLLRHHYRRWTVPRASAPAGRAGYLRWRTSLQEQHARELGEILGSVGYDDETVTRVQAIVRKVGLAHDAEVQALEDALCLVFLETQLADVSRPGSNRPRSTACWFAPRRR